MTRIPQQESPEIAVGQVWTRADGYRIRVEGFTKIDVPEPWIKTREVGGERRRDSYPPTPFLSGIFRLIEDV